MSMVWPRRAAALSLRFAGRPPAVVDALSSAWPREADGAQMKLKRPPPDVRFTPKSGHS
jgi:hypothetical protein